MKLELPLRSKREFVSLNCPASAGQGGGDETYSTYVEEADDPGLRRGMLC